MSQVTIAGICKCTFYTWSTCVAKMQACQKTVLMLFFFVGKAMVRLAVGQMSRIRVLSQGLSAAGFRITACAATPDQAAFVLSVPRRRPMDETQETLRTSAFPSTHVKDKWAKNLYIAGVAYGRTVS